MHTYTHTYIHTYAYACPYACSHICVRLCLRRGVCIIGLGERKDIRRTVSRRTDHPAHGFQAGARSPGRRTDHPAHGLRCYIGSCHFCMTPASA